MTDIVVTKLDESTVRFECEPAIVQELVDYFTFYSPGYRYSPAYKARHWDGKVRLANLKKQTLPAGLTLYVQMFAKENDYTVEVDPALETMNNFSLEEAKEFIVGLKLKSKGQPIEPRDYQVLGFTKAIRYKRVVLVSPTASGKSLMMYMISRKLLENGECKRGLIIVPNVGLVVQLFNDFMDYGWDNANVQKIYEGHTRHVTNPLVISTWQSIFDMEDADFFKQFDFVIGDEAHTFKAASLRHIMGSLTNAKYRIGTTGTLDDYKIHRLYIEGYFGPVSHIATTKKLIEAGHVSDLNIKAIVLGHPEHARALLRQVPTYQVEMDYLVKCAARNKFLMNLALSLETNTLMLFQYVEKHGDVLYDAIAKKAKAGRKVFYVHGGTDAEQRQSICKITEEEKDAIIVASYGVYSTGINIKNLHNIIFASPSKSKIRVLQSIGRGLRLADNKTTATLYDVSDDFRLQKYTNHTLKHYIERIKLYEAEGFKVSKYLVELTYDR